jgi:hypothetical protein
MKPFILVLSEEEAQLSTEMKPFIVVLSEEE